MSGSYDYMAVYLGSMVAMALITFIAVLAGK